MPDGKIIFISKLNPALEDEKEEEYKSSNFKSSNHYKPGSPDFKENVGRDIIKQDEDDEHDEKAPIKQNSNEWSRLASQDPVGNRGSLHKGNPNRSHLYLDSR